DVKGAYPSVDLETLYHEMKKTGIPNEIIDWLRRRFANRETTLTFDDFISALFAVDGGEDQGDPLSSIGYIVY
ncbi:hypothetical protein K435DRAFT_620054, partial [Dendrothele bispora CBS 962.96]